MTAWAVWFRASLREIGLLSWVIAAFALFRMSHASAFDYTGGETILWAVFPVVALINLHALSSQSRASVPLAVLAGSLASGLVTIKYAGAILALGCGA